MNTPRISLSSRITDALRQVTDPDDVVDHDEIDREAEGRQIERAGEADSDTAFGLQREQRMADFVRTTHGTRLRRAVRRPRDSRRVDRFMGGAEAERRVMGDLTGAHGGFLMPDPISANVIDLARNASVVIRAGAITIPMTTKTLRLARVVTDPTPTWRQEGQTIAEDDGVFEGAGSHRARSRGHRPRE